MERTMNLIYVAIWQIGCTSLFFLWDMMCIFLSSTESSQVRVAVLIAVNLKVWHYWLCLSFNALHHWAQQDQYRPAMRHHLSSNCNCCTHYISDYEHRKILVEKKDRPTNQQIYWHFFTIFTNSPDLNNEYCRWKTQQELIENWNGTWYGKTIMENEN